MRTPAVSGLVYVVDDDDAVRSALSSLLRSAGLEVRTFASAEEFLQFERPQLPSCLILDVHLPDGSGIDLPAKIERDARIPVIFITGQGTIPMSVRAMKEGAVEFLTKPFEDEQLLQAVREALGRDGARRRKQNELRELWDRLTPRERQVLALVVRGRLNKQIARELGTAEQTIKVHRGRVMEKLEARSVPDLVRFMEQIADQPWARIDDIIPK